MRIRISNPKFLGVYTEDQCAPGLRAAQNRQWAHKHVHHGIKHFKNGNRVEAFQCLNQALNIDPQNVEGLVARGLVFSLFILAPEAFS